MLGDLIILADSLSIGLGIGLSIVLKAGAINTDMNGVKDL